SSHLPRPRPLPVCPYKGSSPLSLSQPEHKALHLQSFSSSLHFFSSSPKAAVMNVGMCVCVLLAVLSSGSLSLPSQSMSQGEALVSDSLPPPSPDHTRQVRSAPAPPPQQLTSNNQPEEDADSRNRLMNQLLARLISRKGSLYHTRSSLTSRASGLGPVHRIKDRDYLGWMDFGKRSAEEYEYS
ncbi:hypothetical protein LDENG_00047240, partial [Lucifuga dentata]